MADVTPMPMATVVAAVHAAVDAFSTAQDPTDHSARFSTTQLRMAAQSVSEHLEPLCSCGQVLGGLIHRPRAMYVVRMHVTMSMYMRTLVRLMHVLVHA